MVQIQQGYSKLKPYTWAENSTIRGKDVTKDLNREKKARGEGILRLKLLIHTSLKIAQCIKRMFIQIVRHIIDSNIQKEVYTVKLWLRHRR